MLLVQLRDRNTRTRVLEMRGKAREAKDTRRPSLGETEVGCRRKQERLEEKREAMEYMATVVKEVWRQRYPKSQQEAGAPSEEGA